MLTFCDYDFGPTDGASLMYTSANLPSQLPTLIHSSLGITSLLKRQPLKHNVIDRDKIAVPPNWDSWGKIRVLRDGFDVESVSNGWSIDLDQPFPRPGPAREAGKAGAAVNGTGETGEDAATGTEENDDGDDEDDVKDRIEGSTVTLYEDAVEDPTTAALQMAGRDSHSTRLEVETKDPQTFLAEQLKVLEQYRIEAEKEGKGAEAGAPGSGALKAVGAGAGGRASPRPGGVSPDPGAAPVALGAVGDHIGPVQFNMGGIQVDADDMVQRLKVSSFPSGLFVLCSTVLTCVYLASCRTGRRTAHRLNQPAPRTMRTTRLRVSRTTWTRIICRPSSPA